MKKIVFAIGLLLISSVAFAEESPEATSQPEPISLPDEVCAVASDVEVALPENTEIELPSDDIFLTGSCSATADCWNDSTVSCSTSSGSCSFADSNCPGEHGWVTCGWNESHCPPCPCPPPASKCISGRSCTNPCGSECGPGTCINGSCNCLIPDGPRGPIYEFKVGVAVVAQTSRAPILPIGFAARRFWRLKSWDRIIVPLPFSEVTVAVGGLEHLSRELSSEELEAERQRLEELLDELTLRAEAAVGAEDVARP